MKTYEVTLKSEVFYTFEVRANNESEAQQLATNRMESGDWGREDVGRVDIIDLEELK